MNPPTLTISRLTGFGRGKKETCSGATVHLGTAPQCDVRFDATWDKSVSAEHALLRWHEGTLWLEDRSKAGCWIDGQRVPRRQLTPGTEIELGKGGPLVRVDFEPPLAQQEPEAAPRRSSAYQTPPSPAVYSATISVPPPPAAHTSRAHRPSPPSWLARWKWAVVAAIVLLMVGLGFALRPSNADARLSEVARMQEKSVGLVVLTINAGDGPHSIPMATAWAVGPHTFATNAHVAEPVSTLLAKGGSAFIILNRHPEVRHRITRAVVHPKYGAPIVNFEGHAPAVPSFDVGLLEIEGTAENPFRLARRATLERLDSGDRIAYLGFPMEGMAGGGVDFRNPVANLQSGIVTSMTDYWLSKADYPNRLLIQHNLGAAGGSSGSPVFNTKGEVIGILSAGNVVGQVNLETGEATRAPSAVMINFAQRIDILRDIFPAYPAD